MKGYTVMHQHRICQWIAKSPSDGIFPTLFYICLPDYVLFYLPYNISFNFIIDIIRKNVKYFNYYSFFFLLRKLKYYLHQSYNFLRFFHSGQEDSVALSCFFLQRQGCVRSRRAVSLFWFLLSHEQVFLLGLEYLLQAFRLRIVYTL